MHAKRVCMVLTTQTARRYWIEKIYLLLTVLGGGVLLFPTLGAFLDILTLGVAILFPVLWIYASAALPAYAIWKISGRIRFAMFLATLTIIALAIVPGQLANRELRQTLDNYMAQDVSRDVPKKPTSIQFVVDRGYDENTHCEEVCQRLLLAHLVQSVTIRKNIDEKRSVVATYRVKQLKSCPDIFPGGIRMLPSTRIAVAKGTCIISTAGEAMQDGIIIEDREIERWSIPRFSLVSIYSVQQLLISKVEAGHEVLLVKNTMVKAGTAATPFWLYVYWGFLTSVKGVAVGQVQKVYNQHRLLDVLVNVVGLDINTRYCGKPRPYELGPDDILSSQEARDSHCLAR